MSASPAAAAPAELEGISGFVQQVMQDWKVPGLAVAVARGDEIVVAQGFGQRDLAKGLEVTPRTLFAIGSCTKAFTTMALGLLADEGRLDWDTPVKTYLPAFKLHDPFASERMTPRDLVTHRSGLPRHDLMWYGGSFTRQEMVERLQYLEPNKDFRTTWQYQNLMYLTAGYLVEAIVGQSWEEVVQGRIFDRLGMGGSNLSVTSSQQAADFARPYHEKDERVEEMPFREIDTVGPAGSINASVEDMAHWLLLHLNGGMHGGTRFISEGQVAQMHAPQMVIPDDGRWAEVSLPSYGLGWFVHSYRGHTVVHHGGNIDGFSALVSLMPREKIGIVALVNMNGVPVPDLLSYYVYDHLLGLDAVDWNGRGLQDKAHMKEAGEKGKEKSATDRVTGTQPSHPLDAYVGDYAHPGYGVLGVERDGEGLRASFNAFSGPLEHYHYDIFELYHEPFDVRIKLSFSTNVQGDISGLSAPLEPTVADIVFTRRPRQEMTERAFLERFVGEYEVMGITLTVSLKGENALQVVLPGQPQFELEPYKGTEFHLKGLSGFGIEFKSDDSGAVVEAIVTQPGAVLTARKKA